MSTTITKMQNTISGFKSRIPVACGLHRPASYKPLISTVPGRMKSKIPIPKNQVQYAKRQVLSSVAPSDVGEIILARTGDQGIQSPGAVMFNSQKLDKSLEQNRVLDTKTYITHTQERIRGMKTPIQSSGSPHQTVPATSKKPHLKENARPAAMTIMTRKHSPPTRPYSPLMADNSVYTRKISPPTRKSTSIMANRSGVTRDLCPPASPNTNNPVETPKLSPPCSHSGSVVSNKAVVTRKVSPQTGQPTPIVTRKSVEIQKPSPPTGQSTSGMPNKAIVPRKVTPPTGQSTPVVTKNYSVETPKLFPLASKSTAVANCSAESHKFSSPRCQSASFMAKKAVESRKFSPPTGQPVHKIANKPVVSHTILPTSSQSMSKLLNNMVHKGNTSRPLASVRASRVQVLKAAIRQTKAARYLQKMRPRNVPLPGAPQRVPKIIVLPGDYTRLKRTVGKSKLRECSTVRSENVSTKSKARVKRNQKVVLGPKGREHTWKDVSSMPFKVRVLKRTAYDTLESLPKGNPYRYAVHGDEE
ncbi:hypothetical protein EV426DRAFT_611344 [Tirmania nivea]|nr:hypothetical protein EV426DRAFT_611344 [Tirmania nivea]